MPKNIEPKYYAHCSDGLNPGIARTLAEDGARHGARTEKCGDSSVGTVPARVVGYMDLELAEICNDDPQNESCKNYARFKELNVLPTRKGQYCALIAVDPGAIVCRLKKTGSDTKEPAKPVNNVKDEAPAAPPDVPHVPPSAEQKRALTKEVFEEISDRMSELREGDAEKVFKKIFALIEEGLSAEKAAEEVSAYIDELIDSYAAEALKGLINEHKENESLDPEDHHKKMQKKLE